MFKISSKRQQKQKKVTKLLILNKVQTKDALRKHEEQNWTGETDKQEGKTQIQKERRLMGRR